MDTRTDWLPALLQNSDSLFPTGAYAHSAGLEEIVRLGLVADEVSLETFLHEQILPSLAHLELPYVRFAYEAGAAGDLKLLADLAEEISAWKICRETREASLQMGQGRLHAARKIFPHPLMDDLAQTALPKHQIIVYGWQMALAQVPLDPVLAAYSYQALSGICSAALKLIRIGPEGTQRVLRKTLAASKSIIATSLEMEREAAGWFSPILEIAGMRHERADERLFIS